MKPNYQQNQMRRNQEQQRLRQQQAWAQEQEKKRKRRKRQAKLEQSGGINIRDVDGLDVRGDMVGRDKVNQVNASFPRDEKNGFILFIERTFAFIFALAIPLGIAIAVGAGMESAIPIIIGGVFALMFAIATASSISRYRD